MLLIDNEKSKKDHKKLKKLNLTVEKERKILFEAVRKLLGDIVDEFGMLAFQISSNKMEIGHKGNSWHGTFDDAWRLGEVLRRKDPDVPKVAFKTLHEMQAHLEQPKQTKRYPLLAQVFLYSSFMKRSLAKLTLVKSKMDSFDDKEVLNKKLRLFDPSKELKKLLSTDYNCQNISNAWLKCYEIVARMLQLKEQILLLREKGLSEESDQYTMMWHEEAASDQVQKVFFNAELPGSFICSVNHYTTAYNILFDWRANSIVPQNGNKSKLGDYQGIWRHNRNKWLMDVYFYYRYNYEDDNNAKDYEQEYDQDYEENETPQDCQLTPLNEQEEDDEFHEDASVLDLIDSAKNSLGVEDKYLVEQQSNEDVNVISSMNNEIVQEKEKDYNLMNLDIETQKSQVKSNHEINNDNDRDNLIETERDISESRKVSKDKSRQRKTSAEKWKRDLYDKNNDKNKNGKFENRSSRNKERRKLSNNEKIISFENKNNSDKEKVKQKSEIIEQSSNKLSYNINYKSRHRYRNQDRQNKSSKNNKNNNQAKYSKSSSIPIPFSSKTLSTKDNSLETLNSFNSNSTAYKSQYNYNYQNQQMFNQWQNQMELQNYNFNQYDLICEDTNFTDPNEFKLEALINEIGDNNDNQINNQNNIADVNQDYTLNNIHEINQDFTLNNIADVNQQNILDIHQNNFQQNSQDNIYDQNINNQQIYQDLNNNLINLELKQNFTENNNQDHNQIEETEQISTAVGNDNIDKNILNFDVELELFNKNTQFNELPIQQVLFNAEDQNQEDYQMSQLNCYNNYQKNQQNFQTKNKPRQTSYSNNEQYPKSHNQKHQRNRRHHYQDNPQRNEHSHDGDICLVNNLNKMRSQLSKFSKVNLYISDAGVDASNDYNQQEALVCKLFLSQLLCNLKVCGRLADMCVKLYTFSSPVQLFAISAVSLLQAETQVCKPSTSRILNSEVQLVCRRMKDQQPLQNILIKVLEDLVRGWEHLEDLHSRDHLVDFQFEFERILERHRLAEQLESQGLSGQLRLALNNLCRVGDFIHSTRQRKQLEEAIALIELIGDCHSDPELQLMLEKEMERFSIKWISLHNIKSIGKDSFIHDKSKN